MNKEIDPLTGLELSTIGPTAPQRKTRSQTSFDNPEAPFQIAPLQATPVERPQFGLPKTSLIDGIIFGLTGVPTSDLPAEKQQERRSRQAQAQQMAKSAAEDPGEQFMQIGGSASASGGSAIESLGKIVSLFAAGGAGG